MACLSLHSIKPMVNHRRATPHRGPKTDIWNGERPGRWTCGELATWRACTGRTALDCGGGLEGLQLRRTIVLRAGEHLHAVLGVLQLAVALRSRLMPRCVAGQRFLQAYRAFFEIARMPSSSRSASFESGRCGVRTHDASTRLVTSPLATRVRSTSPGCTAVASRSRWPSAVAREAIAAAEHVQGTERFESDRDRAELFVHVRQPV